MSYVINKDQREGYIALVSAIVISVLLIAITFSLSFSSFFGRFNVLYSEFKERSSGLAEACVDTALLKLANNPGYTGNEIIPVGSDSCKIVSVQRDFPVVGQITIKTQAIFRNSYTNIKVVINFSNLSVVSWEECANLTANPAAC